MTLNPVLPPPRHQSVRVDNPVEVLLSARTPQEVRVHFARWRRALQYGWTQDTNYKGSKGGKWVGTDEDAGKVRYQASKPGAGRGGKKEASEKKPAKEKPAGKAPGQQKKGADQDDIVQHLRDVLSGEGEAADELFAKLQDRLSAMTPAQRKAAAARLEKVLGVDAVEVAPEPEKKPAQKPAPKPKAEPKKKPQKGDVNDKGQVYDGRYWRRPPGEKPAPKPRAKKAAAEPEAGASGATRLKSLEDDVKRRLADGEDISREQLVSEVESLKGASMADLKQFVKDLGYKVPPKNKKEAASKIAERLLGAHIMHKRSSTMDQGQTFGGLGDMDEPLFDDDDDNAPVPGSPVHQPPQVAVPPQKPKQPKPGKMADKPTPGQPSGATPQQLGTALKDSLNHLKKFPEYRDGLVDMGALYYDLQERIPDLTREQFHNLLWQLSRDYQVELHVLNEAHMASQNEKDNAIWDDDRMYNYVRLKSKDGDLVPSKKVGADKQFKTRAEYEESLKPKQDAPVPGSPVHQPPQIATPPGGQKKSS